MKSRSRFYLCIAALLMLQACDALGPSDRVGVEDSLAKIGRSKIIKVGYIIYPPAVQRDARTGKLSGHFVDTVEELAHLLGAKTEYHEATWSTFVAGLQSGQFDVSIAPTFRTIPRAQAVAFTRPLFYVGNSAIARKGDKRFQTTDDLKRPNLRIAVTQGEAGYEYAKANLPGAQLTVIASAEQSLAFSEVSAGRVDIALGDAWAVAQYAAVHPEVFDVFGKEPYNLTSVGWAVRPGDYSLLHFLNTSLDFFDDTGKLAEWEHRYKAPWFHKATTWIRN